MEIDLKAVGRRIRKIRSEAGLSGEAFGERIGVSKGAVSTYEVGESFPRWETLNRIVALSGRDFNWLLCAEETSGNRARPPEEAVSAQPACDIGILTDAIRAAEEELREWGIELNPRKKAEVIALLYDLFAEGERRPAKHQVAQIIQLAS